ncbi:MAG: hypothetical protein HQL09_08135 [Nitrospirae bacterium]|nr:hypothetical protein [Nitrospirota bacterium]
MKCRAICILGMHRSGTSAITRSVNFLGAFLGEEDDICTYGPDNPTGFWESLELRLFNERLLYHLKTSWDTSLPLDEGWHLREDLQPFRNELIDLIKKKFSDRNLWAWKDPRTSLLFPLWKDVLKELDIELLCVYAIRNPLDVARSLKKRNGFSCDKGFCLWLNYNISMLMAILTVPTVFVSYDRLLNNWESELRRCAETLKISWPKDDASLREKMNYFIRPDLRHSASMVTDLKKMDAPGPIVELYEFLLNLSEDAKMSDLQFLTTADRLSKEFNKYARFVRHDPGKKQKLKRRLIKVLSLLTWRVGSLPGKLWGIDFLTHRLFQRTAPSCLVTAFPDYLIVNCNHWPVPTDLK